MTEQEKTDEIPDWLNANWSDANTVREARKVLRQALEIACSLSIHWRGKAREFDNARGRKRSVFMRCVFAQERAATAHSALRETIYQAGEMRNVLNEWKEYHG